MNSFFALSVRPKLAAIALLANVSVLAGFLGFPNTMIFDTWLGRTSAGIVQVGNTNPTTLKTSGGTFDILSNSNGGKVELQAKDGSGNVQSVISATPGSVQIGDTTNGATITSPASAITLTSLGQAIVQPASSFGVLIKDGTGAVALQTCGTGGATLGNAGTCLSFDKQVLSSQTPGLVLAGNCNNSSNITVTGAIAGDECIVGVPSSYNATPSVKCIASAANTAVIQWCNQSASNQTPTSGTYSVEIRH